MLDHPHDALLLFAQLFQSPNDDVHERVLVSGSVQSRSSAGDVSGNAGDGMADCGHSGPAPLDVDLCIFWLTKLRIVLPWCMALLVVVLHVA